MLICSLKDMLLSILIQNKLVNNKEQDRQIDEEDFKWLDKYRDEVSVNRNEKLIRKMRFREKKDIKKFEYYGNRVFNCRIQYCYQDCINEYTFSYDS